MNEHAAPVTVALLGPLTITSGESDLELSGPKRHALLALLALHAGRPLSRDLIVEALWPTARTGREESTLRVHISHLRDVLEPVRDADPVVLVTRGSGYMLNNETVQVDVDEFERLAHEGRDLLATDPGGALEVLNRALGIWRGRPLEDVEYLEFAQDPIRRLEMERHEAVLNRAEALVELGEDAAAIEDLEPLVRSHPTQERQVCLLMRAFYRSGRHADALRVARRHARQLGRAGLDMSPTVRQLEDRILQHDPTLMPEGATALYDIRPGRSVRGYELREEAGAGTTGVVFRGFQPSVGREVAVKVVHHALAEEPDFVRRFAEEARVVAGLEHPHIVPLHDYWREPAGAFLVMRWMDGGSLEGRLGGAWENADIGRVFGQLAEALGFAHSAGIVHRDVKPANVLFDSSGNAYLCDFGLAVAGIESGPGHTTRPATLSIPYASPELLRGEGPTVASDIYSLGVLLAETVSGEPFRGPDTPLDEGIRNIVAVATAQNPADRYPDMLAFSIALRDAVGASSVPAPRRVRRNPYKGLSAFNEGDSADFYGREAVVESILGLVGANGLTAVIGASGSGKSSVVMAGVVPQLRSGALRGSDEWSVIRMVPGIDPFDEFQIGLQAAAVGRSIDSRAQRSSELREGFLAALDGPQSYALLVVDQFEEVFSSEVDETTRRKFLDELVELAADPAHRIRVILTLRADFADRPMAYLRFGELMSKASFLLASMQPADLEAVIRQPASRVGVQIEPGLVSEVVRDVSSAPAHLPLLQYVLSELFERRTEDRLTVHAYRSLGGVEGVLERRAEATFSSLSSEARHACRQLFLRLVHVGDHGEETRRRLPLTELRGLGGRADTDEALKAFSAVRLLTYDRDPITRTPTVEVAHETVIRTWTRYRIWIDEARADLLAHRRISIAANTWVGSEEDPAYLLVGGPLEAALLIESGDRVGLNDLEARFVAESREAAAASLHADEERREREAMMEHRARRRLTMGLGVAAVAIVIGVLAVFAWVQRQRANDLAAQHGRQSTARELAAASLTNLTSADPDLSLLLAIAGADLSIAAGEEIVPEIVDALHQAVINPRPDFVIDGAGTTDGAQLVQFSHDETQLVVLTADGGAMIIDVGDGTELARLPPADPAAFGVDFRANGHHVLTIHRDGVRQWDWRSGEIARLFDSPVQVATAAYSPDGSLVAVGGQDGVIRVWNADSGDLVAELEGVPGDAGTIDFDPSGTRLLSGGNGALQVWDVASGEATNRIKVPGFGPAQVTWNPTANTAAVAMVAGEIFLIDTDTGARRNSFGNGQNGSKGVAFDASGRFLVAAGEDGFARLFGTAVGGEAAVSLSAGGVPVGDAALGVAGPLVATVGLDGKLRVFRDILGSELPIRPSLALFPSMKGTPDGTRYLFGGNILGYGLPESVVPTVQVVESATGEILARFPVAEGVGSALATISPSGTLVGLDGPGGLVAVVTVDTGIAVDMKESEGATGVLAFSPDDTRLVGGAADGSITIWDAATGDVLASLRGHGDRVPSSRATGDQSAGSGGGFSVFSTFRVDDIAFRPSGTEFASVGFDGTLRVWDVTTGQGRIVHEFPYSAQSVAYSLDGELLAAADESGEVVVFDANSGAVVIRPQSVPGTPDLAFSPDGLLLAGAGPGPVVYVWSVDSGLIVRRLRGALYRLTSLAFVNGGTELRAASGEGIDRGYLLDPVALVELARTEVTRALTEGECLQYLRRSCDA